MDNRPAITVLTDPIPGSLRYPNEALHRIVRSLADVSHLRRKSPLGDRRYRGHFAVTRGLLQGFDKIGIHYSYNPWTFGEVADTVVVLSSIKALAQVIQLKSEGRINKILAGPNLVEFPLDAGGLLEHPLVDFCLTPSQWVNHVYEKEAPTLVGRCVAWPAGVDANYWSPTMDVRLRDSIIVFDKTAHDQSSGQAKALARECIESIERCGLPFEHLAYGTFSRDSYQAALRKSRLLIGFSASESQGIAWAEAWACDVPTLILRNDETTYRGRSMGSSSAPYLGPETGAFFSDLDSMLRMADEQLDRDGLDYAPREWVLSHMTDEVSARHLLNIAV
jgi:hypothetical protein